MLPATPLAGDPGSQGYMLTARASASNTLPVRDYSSSKPQADTTVPAEAGNVDLALDQGHLLQGSANRGLSTHSPGNAQLYGKS